MLRATWTAGSLRMWVFIGMALAVLPLLISALLGYHLIYRGVMADFVDVAQRQRDQIVPAHRLQLDLANAIGPLELYLDDSTPDELAAYRAARERIDAGFAALQHALGSELEARALIERARTDWSRADEVAQDILARRWPPGAANGLDLARRFETTIAAATAVVASPCALFVNTKMCVALAGNAVFAGITYVTFAPVFATVAIGVPFNFVVAFDPQ